MAAKSTTSYEGFTEEERAAMKEHAQELKKAARRGAKSEADGEADVLAKIAEFPEGDRRLAERVHAIVKENAPHLTPKLWYGQPAYAKDGKVVCFFQPSSKFKTRYSTLGFNDAASLDDGVMWPTAYALTELDAETEKRIAEIVRRAAG
ncbi:iron chaperone [Nonomuraea fastidiosa]|uniref:iron chaperone n=1 Tax=Nonomuraea fastidiosa TaxID=46173 RepID=UPI0036722747